MPGLSDADMRAARNGATARRLGDTAFLDQFTVYGKNVVRPYDWSTWSMSLRHPFTGPRVAIVCGRCSAASKGAAVTINITRIPQDWSIVQCQNCHTPNAVPFVLKDGTA